MHLVQVRPSHAREQVRGRCTNTWSTPPVWQSQNPTHSALLLALWLGSFRRNQNLPSPLLPSSVRERREIERDPRPRGRRRAIVPPFIFLTSDVVATGAFLAVVLSLPFFRSVVHLSLALFLTAVSPGRDVWVWMQVGARSSRPSGRQPPPPQSFTLASIQPSSVPIHKVWSFLLPNRFIWFGMAGDAHDMFQPWPVAMHFLPLSVGNVKHTPLAVGILQC